MNINLTPPPERDFPAARLALRKQQLLARIEAEEQGRPPRRFLDSRNRRVVGIALAAAAAVTIAMMALLPGGNRDTLSAAGPYIHSLPRVSTSQPEPRQLVSLVLLRAAHTAASQRATTPGPGQFVYTKSESEYEIVQEGRDGPLAIAFQPSTREIWISPNGSGRILDVERHLLFATRADAAHFYHAYRNQMDLLEGHTSDDHEKDLGYIDLSNVPTDPAKLKQLIETRKLEGGPPGNAETFQIISDLLRETSAAPAVRSALYTIASQLPGVELIGPTHDQIGRPGTGVAYVSRGLRNELIFDSQTSALLGEQQTVVERSKENPFLPGTVIGWAAYLASGIVNSTSDTTSATP
jgi:hypothetical protein